MARTLKQTRIKGIPPKIQLQIRDSLSGSFPTRRNGISSDNRTGVYSASFNDTNTSVFTGSTVIYPIGLAPGNPAFLYYNQSGVALENPEIVTDITTSGFVRKGLGDSYTVIRRQGQELEPFRDYQQYAADATTASASFFALGSAPEDIGIGFENPLWAKSKVEIDLSPSTEHSFSLQNGTSGTLGLNYPMAYWNPSLRKYQGIGTGKVFHSYASGSTADIRLTKLKHLLEDQCIGFGESLFEVLGSPNPQVNESRGQVISNFGFPYHPKFHATSSNCVEVSDYISEPFLVEKIVLEFSGAFGLGATYATGSSYSYNAASTGFFLLNQRGPFAKTITDYQTINYASSATSSFVTGVQIPGEGANTNSTFRELITTLRIGSFISGSATVITGSEQMNANYNIFVTAGPSGSGGPPTWSGRYTISGIVANQIPNSGMSVIITNTVDDTTFLLLKLQSGVRSGLFGTSGRSFIAEYSSGEVRRTETQNGFTQNVLKNYTKNNPYLLMPGDKLIIGWQIPYSNILNEDTLGVTEFPGQGGYLRFAQAPAKLVLYGSSISENQECHDTLNQLLSSETIHEVIG